MAKKNLEWFQNEKNFLLSKYDKLYSLKLLSDETVNEKDFISNMENLLKEKFIVTISGQIKAGKSTLINAVVFEDNVLPVSPTPHTAKITTIDYSEENYFEVSYYNKKEWESLKNLKYTLQIDDKTTVEKNYFDDFLKEDFEKSISSGVEINEYICDYNKKERINEITRLDEFVTADGRFTPFVKTVSIYCKNEMLKNVTIVDTPGINDPNILRSKMTEDWMKNSNANIYVCYAGAAMDSSDIEFIDKYLIGVPNYNRIIAINKVDVLNNGDPQRLKSWIEELRNNEELKKRKIFDETESIIFVSALSSIIMNKLSRNEVLGQSLEHHKARFEKIDFLRSERNNIEELRKIIEEKIIRNKGQNLIDAHKKFLDSVVIKNMNITRRNFIEISERYNLIQQNKDKLNESREILESNRENIYKYIEEMSTNYGNIINNFMFKFISDMNIIFDEILNKVSYDISRITNMKYIIPQSNWIFKNNMEKSRDKIIECFKNNSFILSQNIRELIKEVESKISIINNTVNFEFLNTVISANIHDFMVALNKINFMDMHFESISQKKLDSGMIYNSDPYMNQEEIVKRNIISSYSVYLKETLLKQLQENAKNHLNTSLENFIKKLKIQIDESVTQIEDDIIKVTDEKEDKNELLKTLHDEMERIEERNEFLRNLRKEIM